MVSIRQAELDHDQAVIQDLFREYLEWANARLSEEYGFTFDVEVALSEGMAKIDEFLPPDGRLLLVMEGTSDAGIACLRKNREGVVEVKRMYVRPEFRGSGIGRALLETLLDAARELGSETVRLDSARFMKAAHGLYRSAGFREIEPYAESEIPPEYRQYWVFMEKSL